MEYQVDLTDYSESEDIAIDWEMDEYLEYRRGPFWYVVLLSGAAVFAIISYIAIGEIIAPLSILAMAVLVLVYSLKKPGRKKYSLTALGLRVGSRLYDYSSFKTFSLVKEQGVAALYLATNQRFLPPLTIYLPLDKDKRIVKRLSRYIAYTPRNIQWSDRLMTYLRF